MEIWEVRSRTKKQFEYVLLEKMRLPNLHSKKLDFADKTVKFMEIWEVRSRTKKQFEYVLLEKMRLPNLQKARFCKQNWEIHGNLGGQEPDEKTIWICSTWKNALAQPPKS